MLINFTVPTIRGTGSVVPWIRACRGGLTVGEFAVLFLIKILFTLSSVITILKDSSINSRVARIVSLIFNYHRKKDEFLKIRLVLRDAP